MESSRFTDLYDATARPLWAYIYRCSGDRHLADDLTQEVFYRFLRRERQLDSDQHARNYLFRIATNLLGDHFGRRARRRDALDEAPRPERGHMPEDASLRPDLERAMHVLNPRERMLVWMAHVEGLSHEEMATTFDLQATSVRVVLFRIRKKLACELRRLGWTDPGR